MAQTYSLRCFYAVSGVTISDDLCSVRHLYITVAFSLFYHELIQTIRHCGYAIQQLIPINIKNLHSMLAGSKNYLFICAQFDHIPRYG